MGPQEEISKAGQRGRKTGRGCWRRRAALRREARPTALPSSSSRTGVPRSPRRASARAPRVDRVRARRRRQARAGRRREPLPALLLLAPVILLVAALVRLESYGPAFFQAPRVGYGGRDLLMLKFRKMHHRARGIPLTLDHRRPLHPHRRVSSPASSSTSCPQLWHVLRGDMSLVGPRPETRRVREPPPRGLQRDPLRAARACSASRRSPSWPRAGSSTRRPADPLHRGHPAAEGQARPHVRARPHAGARRADPLLVARSPCCCAARWRSTGRPAG